MLKKSIPCFPSHLMLQATRRTLIARYLCGYNSLRIDNSSTGVKEEGDFWGHTGGKCILLGGIQFTPSCPIAVRSFFLFLHLRLRLPGALFRFRD